MSERTARRQRLVEEDRAGPAEGEPMKVDADWLLTRLAAEAEADIADLYDEAGDLLPIRQWPAIWLLGG